MTFCTQCGKELPDGQTLCEECAAAAAPEAPEAPAAPQFRPEYTAPPVQAAYVPAQSAFHIPMTKEQLPEEFKPLGAWAYFGYNLLFGIPLIGFILLIVFALGGTRNVNLRSYARSFFCAYLIVAILVVALLVLGLVLGHTFADLAGEIMYH